MNIPELTVIVELDDDGHVSEAELELLATLIPELIKDLALPQDKHED